MLPWRLDPIKELATPLKAVALIANTVASQANHEVLAIAAQFAPLHGDATDNKVYTFATWHLGIQSPARSYGHVTILNAFDRGYRHHLDRRIPEQLTASGKATTTASWTGCRCSHRLLPGVRQERYPKPLPCPFNKHKSCVRTQLFHLARSPDAGKRTGPYLTRLLLV